MANDGNRDDANEGKTPEHADSDRRDFLKVTGLGAAGVAAGLAGCTGPSDGGDGGDGGGGDGGDGGSGGLPDTIRVGALGPAEQSFGSSIIKSVELAADEINNDGGIGESGATVEVVSGDTKDQPSVARQRYGEMTSGGNAVDATIGIFGSEQLLALMQNIAQKETVHLTAGSATPEAPAQVKSDYDKYKYWFRVGPVNSSFLGDSLLQYAEDRFADMGWERVAFVAEQYKWTEPVTRKIKNNLEDRADVTLTSARRVSEGTEDFSPVYDQLESENVDGCFTALAHTGVNALGQWAGQQRPFGFGGIHVPTQLPSFYEATSGAAIATFSQTTATPNAAVTEKTIPYAEAYNEANDAFPVYSGYSAYDAMYLLKEAIESAGTLNSDDLVTELEATSYTGTSGQIEFYGEDKKYPHDVRYGAEYARGVYFQWQQENGEGVQKTIWPDNLADAEYKKPPWV
jgi:branched-chain amino acid transport system substrate-binding protein